MAEKRVWTEEEDRLLKYVYETSKLTKWSHIARRLQEDHGLKGRNGKQCKERYISHIDTSHPKEEWTYTDEQRLFDLHNQLGNKWAIIGSRLEGRTDNCVKNHFYSKLRKALKKLNRVVKRSLKKELKEVKPNVLYRIVEVVEEKFKEIPKFDKEFSNCSNKLKNELLELSYDDEVEEDKEEESINVETAKEVIGKIIEFGANYKRKTKKSSTILEQDLLTPTRYQRVRKCNSENEESEGSSSMIQSSDTSNFQDISDDEISRTNSKRSRKNSQEFGANTLPVGRIRTRAYSQGNARERSEQLQELAGMKNQGEQQKNKHELQQQFGELNIFQEQDNIPPHPLLMKKETSKYSRYSENVVEKEEFYFFDDSEIEMRILPEMAMGTNKESQYEENIFN